MKELIEEKVVEERMCCLHEVRNLEDMEILVSPSGDVTISFTFSVLHWWVTTMNVIFMGN